MESSNGVDVLENTDLIAGDRVAGTPIRRTDGRKIGAVKRVVIEKATGKVAYVVVGIGGLFGLGEDVFALPWAGLRYNSAMRAYEIAPTENLLNNFSADDGNYGIDFDAPAWQQEIATHYGEASSWL